MPGPYGPGHQVRLFYTAAVRQILDSGSPHGEIAGAQAHPGVGARPRTLVEIEGLQVPVLRRSDLVRNKRALGRPRDLADVAELEGEVG